MFFNVVVQKVNLNELEGILNIAVALGISEVMLNSMINLYPLTELIKKLPNSMPILKFVKIQKSSTSVWKKSGN